MPDDSGYQAIIKEQLEKINELTVRAIQLQREMTPVAGQVQAQPR